MNGNRYILDTNAIIALLQGNQKLLNYTDNASWIGISIISQLEFLSFTGLSDNDRDCFKKFTERVETINLTLSQTNLIELIVNLRQKYKIKLPDSIIIATAIEKKASLITADDRLKQVLDANIIDFI